MQKKARTGQNFTEAEARKIIMPVLEGLKFLHSKSIVHGNLKPSDILFDENQDVKIPGIVNSNYSGADFPSPEMKKGLEPTALSDIWSLGVIMHVMLTGRYPSKMENERVNTKLLDKCSKEAVDLMKIMLDPEQK